MLDGKSIDPPVNLRLKFGILILLCAQNAGHALLARFSNSILKESYSTTEVVFVAEVMKVFASAFLMFSDKADTDAVGSGTSKAIWLLLNSTKIILLVVSYAVANILAYYALARVDAAVYTVMLQLKILTTAAFSVVFLGRHFSGAKWRALFLLVLGCILVASPAFNKNETCNNNNNANSSKSSTETDDEQVSIFQAILGIGAILAMVTISGYTAVYFESMLKKEKVTVWERNFQMAFYSMLLLGGIMISEHSYEGDYENMFQGWTTSAVILAVIQAGGGLLVAATLKYADSILKTLATSGSIVLSAILGHFLMDGTLDIFVSIGCVCTILAISNYTWDMTPDSK